MIIIVSLIYLYFCHLTAKKASMIGNSYFRWFLIAFFVDPILAFVLLAMFN
jgi:hypothetical protein